MLVGLALAGGLTALSALALRALCPEWWRRPAVRRAVWALPALLTLAALLWGLGFWLRLPLLTRVGAVAVAFGLVTLVVGPAVLLVSGAVLWAHRRPAPAGVGPPLSRRALLGHAATAVPALAALATGTSIAATFRPVPVRLRRLGVPALPAGLAGLRLWHLTDAHLGVFRDLADLEDAVRQVRRDPPDLTLVTGDLVDDPDLLPRALALIASAGARHGAFACLGNHEFMHGGIERTERDLATGPVRLLKGSGVTLRIHGQALHLGGADDPHRVRRQHQPAYLAHTVSQALRGAPAGAFTLLLCHRPGGFDPARRHGVGLVLAGHTHGGQVGHAGRSAWGQVGIGPEYLWGAYRRDRSLLWVSAGFGHWLPLRIGCPAEAPILELVPA
jgi:hypothetical protein